jgi:4-hydroxybenzoyl-CoA thioesterase
MPRVAIELPERFFFETLLPIRIDDINYGGHLGHDAVFKLVQEVRVRFLREHGWTELDLGGVGLIMADAAAVYRAEAFHGDVLAVKLGAADVRTRGCDLVALLADSAGGREIARVKTGLLFFDYAARKVVAMPEAFRRAIAGP